MAMNQRKSLLDMLERHKLSYKTGVSVSEINDDYVKAVDTNGEKSFPCDTVVMATGFKSDSALADSLKAEGLNVYTIGDYNSPRKVVNATCEGYAVIRNLG